MSGRMQGPSAPIMSAVQASHLLDQIVQDRVREQIDMCGLLDFQLELRLALADCGVPADEVKALAADMIARAFTRIGEHHVQVAAEVERSSVARG